MTLLFRKSFQFYDFSSQVVFFFMGTGAQEFMSTTI